MSSQLGQTRPSILSFKLLRTLIDIGMVTDKNNNTHPVPGIAQALGLRQIVS